MARGLLIHHRITRRLLASLALVATLAGCGRGESPAAPRPAPAEGPRKPPRSGADWNASAKLSDGILSVAIRLPSDPAEAPVPITISIDVYAAESPSHPDRHWAFWNVDLVGPKRARDLLWKIDTRAKRGNLFLDGAPADLRSGSVRIGEWRGPFSKGRIKGVVAVWPCDDPSHPRVYDLFTAEAGENGLSGFHGSGAPGSF